jgi:hypothetical protein
MKAKLWNRNIISFIFQRNILRASFTRYWYNLLVMELFWCIRIVYDKDHFSFSLLKIYIEIEENELIDAFSMSFIRQELIWCGNGSQFNLFWRVLLLCQWKYIQGQTIKTYNIKVQHIKVQEIKISAIYLILISLLWFTTLDASHFPTNWDYPCSQL